MYEVVLAKEELSSEYQQIVDQVAKLNQKKREDLHDYGRKIPLI